MLMSEGAMITKWLDSSLPKLEVQSSLVGLINL
jgi:hypothetical protein